LWPARLPHTTSYKNKNDPAVRQQIVRSLSARAPWLALENTDLELLHASDDCLDALICALVAKACAESRTIPPPDASRASVEGWIHIPKYRDVLDALIPRSSMRE
jgi:hypothetical protein